MSTLKELKTANEAYLVEIERINAKYNKKLNELISAYTKETGFTVWEIVMDDNNQFYIN